MAANGEFMTIGEAARYCGVSRSTMIRWWRRRQVGRRHRGREIILSRAEVEVLRGVHSLDDVIRSAASVTGFQNPNGSWRVRMNTYLMARHDTTVLELYDPSDPAGPRAKVVRVTLEEV